jgi:heme oxygenase
MSIRRVKDEGDSFVELTTLRSATATQHRNAEKDLDLLRPSFTLGHYVALLKGFYGFHLPWESKVEAALETELPDFFKARKKLQHLAEDLRYFGSETEDLSSIVPCRNLPLLDSIGSVLGSVYVIEGSSLGGRLLTRHFGEHLGIRPDTGCRYFSGYGERTGQMWSAFGELMARRPPAESEEMLTAAVSTFELLGGWLQSKDNG